jgi:hypothetical protein
VTLDVDTAASASATRPALFSGPQAARLLGELPGESWLALSAGGAGTSFAAEVKGLEELTTLGGSLAGKSSGSASTSSLLSGLSVGSLLEGLLRPLRIMAADTPSARRQFGSWTGAAAVFAGGENILELEGGVVIESKSAARSRAAIPALEVALRKDGASVQRAATPGAEASIDATVPGLPLALTIAAGRNSSGRPELVVGLSGASVHAALDPPGTLASAGAYRSATRALGGAAPEIIAGVPTLLGLLEGAGLSEASSISGALRGARAITNIYGGAHTVAGAVNRFELLVGLR